MRSQTTLATQAPTAPDKEPDFRPMSVYEAELFARQERARLIGEMLAGAIFHSWRLLQRINTGLRSRRAPARATAS